MFCFSLSLQVAHIWWPQVKVTGPVGASKHIGQFEPSKGLTGTVVFLTGMAWWMGGWIKHCWIFVIITAIIKAKSHTIDIIITEIPQVQMDHRAIPGRLQHSILTWWPSEYSLHTQHERKQRIIRIIAAKQNIVKPCVEIVFSLQYGTPNIGTSPFRQGDDGVWDGVGVVEDVADGLFVVVREIIEVIDRENLGDGLKEGLAVVVFEEREERDVVGLAVGVRVAKEVIETLGLWDAEGLHDGLDEVFEKFCCALAQTRAKNISEFILTRIVNIFSIN